MRKSALTTEAAEEVAVSALAFVASDETLLPRFLSLTGIAAQDIRAAAREPGFLAGVLDFVLAHEPTLLAFATAENLDPATLLAARRALPLGDDRHERST